VQTVPEIKRWRRDEYHRLGEQGFLTDERDELIGGQIITMPPEGPRHAATTTVALEALRVAFASVSAHVRAEKPLALGVIDEPRPDLAVVVGTARDYGDEHPRPDQTLLVVEVADSSQEYDLGAKADMYATAGISDYWVACVVPRVVVVFRQPVAVAVGPPRETGGHTIAYAERREYRPGESITPLGRGGQPVAVTDLLL
jgi:Uma2 family endonuclease